jgi:hypothetical protein
VADGDVGDAEDKVVAFINGDEKVVDTRLV